MSTQPLTVECTSCSAKFRVPDELVRGKVVKFRCRKCGGAIDVDGRSRPSLGGLAAADTPATFSQTQPTRSSLPRLEPPGFQVPDADPWRGYSAHSTTAPTAMPDTTPAEGAPLPTGATREPTSGTKVAALVVLLVAAGLSVFGFLLRQPAHDGIPMVAGSTAETRAAAVHAGPGTEVKAAPAHPQPPATAVTKVTELPLAAGVVERARKVEPAAEMPKPAADLAPKENPTTADETIDPAEAEIVARAAASALAPAEPPPTEPTPAAPPPVAAPLPAPPPQAAAPHPAAPRETSYSSRDFNTQAAREALDDAGGRATSCRNQDTPPGAARVAVTFAPNGHVTSSVIDSGPFVGTAAGACVASKFRSARVPPFAGDSVTVRKSINF